MSHTCQVCHPNLSLSNAGACDSPSVPQCAAGGNGSVVVERGVSARQESDNAKLLPRRVPGPAHPGSTCMSQQGKTTHAHAVWEE